MNDFLKKMKTALDTGVPDENIIKTLNEIDTIADTKLNTLGHDGLEKNAEERAKNAPKGTIVDYDEGLKTNAKFEHEMHMDEHLKKEMASIMNDFDDFVRAILESIEIEMANIEKINEEDFLILEVEDIVFVNKILESINKLETEHASELNDEIYIENILKIKESCLKYIADKQIKL